MKRTVTVKLQPSKEQEKALFELARATAVIWNRLNYERLKQFKEFGKINFNGTEKEAYHEFKTWIGVQQSNNWREKTPKPGVHSSPSTRRNRVENSRGGLSQSRRDLSRKRMEKIFIIPLRNDQYWIEGNVIELRRLGKFGRLKIQFKGRVYFKGKQGRLEVHYNQVRRKWYAHVSFTVEEKLINGEWVKVPKEPLGTLSAGVDLGVNNLMAVYVENGESLLVNGRPLKSIAFYWQRRIAEYQSKLNKSGCKTSRKLKRMHEKAKLQAKHYINTAVRQTVEGFTAWSFEDCSWLSERHNQKLRQRQNAELHFIPCLAV